MKSFFATLALSLSLLQSTAVALSGIPVGSPDGVYVGKLDPNGTTIWEFVTNSAPASNTKRDDSSAAAITKRADGVNCQNVVVNSFDRENAVQALIDRCGNGYFYTGSAIAVQSGGVIAYGCNYGTSQTCFSWDVRSFLFALYNNCGGDRAAWWGQSSWFASYGYTALGQGFC
ncbi:hypothetical protein QBC44DRAFT_355362 [Cladorrhinum sp. PSN332]|nr:hypothetical protein QBC44DRAFT_355362 [Cladorrhinum sp. PSN332]